jgi:thiamine biosynthesis lipoprotein
MHDKQFTFQAIGTHWQIHVLEPITEDACRQLMHTMHARIQAFDKTYSRFRADSLVTQMSEKAGEYPLPADGFQLLQLYERLYQATAGKVTPLIGQTIAAAGYDAHYTFQPHMPARPERWEDVLSYTHDSIRLRRPALLDFGAAGKGYLVDIIGELFEEAGVHVYLINAGGDIRLRSKQAVEIAMENPQDTTEAIGIVQLANGSLCASAGSKRTWGTYHHIIDPDSVQSSHARLATWVCAADTLTADGLATALFFVDPAALQRQFRFSYAILENDMELTRSADFPGTVFETAA